MEQEYRDMVDKNLAENSSEIFGNFSREHAGYIIAQFISKAQKSIEILSGNFADSFYDGISAALLLEQAATRIKENNGLIRIITINGTRCNYLTNLVAEINRKLQVETVKYIPARCQNPEKVNHFMVVDAMRYRLEESHPVAPEGEAPQCVKAEICCNGPQKAAILLKDFNDAWNRLEVKPLHA